MNWGLRITILYLGFVTLILALVFTTMGHKVDLVSKDYYQQELRFQDRIDAIANSNALVENIRHSVVGRKVELSYPGGMLAPGMKGRILFFRPSDPELDLQFEMKPSANGLQVIESPRFARGMYKMQFQWQMNGKEYFREEVVFIQ